MVKYRQKGINLAGNHFLMSLDLGPLQLLVGRKLTDSHCSFSFLLALLQYKYLTNECLLGSMNTSCVLHRSRSFK